MGEGTVGGFLSSRYIYDVKPELRFLEVIGCLILSIVTQCFRGRDLEVNNQNKLPTVTLSYQ